MPQGVSSSVFRKLTNFLVGRRTDGDISPAEANRIQQSAYLLAHTEIKKKFSPTWQTIALELSSEEKQVFEGTVWYLAKIAINKPKYREDILELLQKKASEKNINPEFRDYLKQQIKNIVIKNNQ